MDRDRAGGGPIVLGFSSGGFRTEDGIYPALLLTPEQATLWSPPPLAVLDLATLQPLIDMGPEFVLLGTGIALARPPQALVAALDDRGIGLEAMDSRAAARAWGLLRGEGRVIAAALYPIT